MRGPHHQFHHYLHLRRVPLHLRAQDFSHHPEGRLRDHHPVLAAVLRVRNAALCYVGRPFHLAERVVRERFGLHYHRRHHTRQHRGPAAQPAFLAQQHAFHRRFGSSRVPAADYPRFQPGEAQARQYGSRLAVAGRLCGPHQQDGVYFRLCVPGHFRACPFAVSACGDACFRCRLPRDERVGDGRIQHPQRLHRRLRVEVDRRDYDTVYVSVFLALRPSVPRYRFPQFQAAQQPCDQVLYRFHPAGFVAARYRAQDGRFLRRLG